MWTSTSRSLHPFLKSALDPNKPNFNVQEAGGKYDAWATPGLEDPHSTARMNDHHQLMSRVHQEIQKRYDPISGNSVVAPMDRDPPILIMKGHAQDVKSVQGIEVPRSDRPRCNLGSEALSRSLDRSAIPKMPKQYGDGRPTDKPPRRIDQTWTSTKKDKRAHMTRTEQISLDSRPLEEIENEVTTRVESGDLSVFDDVFVVNSSQIGDHNSPLLTGRQVYSMKHSTSGPPRKLPRKGKDS